MLNLISKINTAARVVKTVLDLVLEDVHSNVRMGL